MSWVLLSTMYTTEQFIRGRDEKKSCHVHFSISLTVANIKIQQTEGTGSEYHSSQKTRNCQVKHQHSHQTIFSRTLFVCLALKHKHIAVWQTNPQFCNDLLCINAASRSKLWPSAKTDKIKMWQNHMHTFNFPIFIICSTHILMVGIDVVRY